MVIPTMGCITEDRHWLKFTGKNVRKTLICSGVEITTIFLITGL